MRIVSVAAAVLALSMPLAGQAPGGRMKADPDIKAAGGAALPAGWQARLDESYAKIENLKFVTMGTGFHSTTGPAAIFYQPTTTAKGNYQVKATFTQTKLSAHPEAFGLFIGGANLQGDGQKYTYFEVRQDGQFLIKRRIGAQTPTIRDWTDNKAVTKPDAKGKYTNTLSIVVGKDTVKFLINGTEVASQPRNAVDAEGIAGLRINHNLDVHIDGFAVQAGTSH